VGTIARGDGVGWNVSALEQKQPQSVTPVGSIPKGPNAATVPQAQQAPPQQLQQQHLQQQQQQKQQQQIEELTLQNQQLQQQQQQHQQQLEQQQLEQQQQQYEQYEQQQHYQQFQLQQQKLQQQQLQQQQLQHQHQQEQQQQQQQQQQPKHHLIAAAIVEEEGMDSGRQSKATVLPLVLTLSVQGSTQNVQFDFDLISDDAIKVAREMVSELGIPEEAILEISETISGLASSARSKREDQQQVLQQEMNDKEDELVQKMKDLISQNTEQQQQHQQQQIQLQEQQYQLDQQQIQLDQQQLDKQELNHQQHLLQSPEFAQGPSHPIPDEQVVSVAAKGSSQNQVSDEESELERNLGRIDDGYRFSMAQARKVYDNRISDLQQGQDERDAKHLDAMELHEKNRAEFQDLMKQTQDEELSRIGELQREWDERRNQMVNDRKLRKKKK